MIILDILRKFAFNPIIELFGASWLRNWHNYREALDLPGKVSPVKVFWETILGISG